MVTQQAIAPSTKVKWLWGTTGCVKQLQ